MTQTGARLRKVVRKFSTAVVALAAAAVPSSAAPPLQPPDPLLEVPYLSQTEALCGAAAIAMVMRYWGTTGVYAETFAALVDAEAGGIRGSELVRALDERGFEAKSFSGDLAIVRAAVKARQPLVALIEDAPGRFHYVVVVGWRDGQIVLHDPARAPYRVVASDAFLRAWSSSERWTLLARPRFGAAAPSNARADEAGVAPGRRGVCAGMVDEGIRLAGSGDLPGAEKILRVASSECAQDSAPIRELAGVYALREDWEEAAAHARMALERDGGDVHAARILATSLFLTNRQDAALDAWNRAGGPAIDLVDIRGLERTRFAVAEEALGLETRTILTRSRLARARRRLESLPPVVASRVAYAPRDNDLATITAAVVERPLIPSGLVPLGALALRAGSDRELPIHIASPTGGGELWSFAWRWWEGRPRVALGLAAPSPFGGVWGLEAVMERQTYGVNDEANVERRRGVSLTASDWITGRARLQGGVSIDRWRSTTTASLHGRFVQEFGSHAGASVEAALITGGYRSAALGAGIDWRSTDRRLGSEWLARVGVAAAGAGAPLAFWPGAGTGQGRDVLLRAHTLLDDGRIRGVFGRTLVHAGGEWRGWRGPVFRAVRVAPAVFVDVARAYRVPAFGDGRLQADVGVGVRAAVPGAGVLRVDLARGLRDGSTALSLGWMR